MIRTDPSQPQYLVLIEYFLIYRGLHEKKTNRKDWKHEKCISVWTKTGLGLLPKTNSEYSQMDFPSQSCVNERKQGSASQGLYCDTEHRSSFNGLIEGNLQEFGPHSYLPSLVRGGNPRLGYLENSCPASALRLLYERISDSTDIHMTQKSHCQT